MRAPFTWAPFTGAVGRPRDGDGSAACGTDAGSGTVLFNGGLFDSGLDEDGLDDNRLVRYRLKDWLGCANGFGYRCLDLGSRGRWRLGLLGYFGSNGSGRRFDFERRSEVSLQAGNEKTRSRSFDNGGERLWLDLRLRKDWFGFCENWLRFLRKWLRLRKGGRRRSRCRGWSQEGLGSAKSIGTVSGERWHRDSRRGVRVARVARQRSLGASSAGDANGAAGTTAPRAANRLIMPSEFLLDAAVSSVRAGSFGPPGSFGMNPAGG